MYLNPARLAKFLGVLTLEAFTAAAFGMLVGCVAKDGDAALAIGPPLMTIFILFSGPFPSLLLAARIFYLT